MSVQVTLTFANVQEMQAYFVGREVIAAAPKVEKPAAPKPEKASSKSLPESPTTQPAAAPVAEQPEGNVTAATTEAASTTAPTASSETSTVDFETVKKAFLALSVKDGGRARCEQVLKPFALAKLSEAKPEQYGQILEAIKKAAV